MLQFLCIYGFISFISRMNDMQSIFDISCTLFSGACCIHERTVFYPQVSRQVSLHQCKIKILPSISRIKPLFLRSCSYFRMNENMEFPGISGEDIQWLQDSFVQTIFTRLEVSYIFIEHIRVANDPTLVKAVVY